jgi:acyl-CoA thioester hydrolase
VTVTYEYAGAPEWITVTGRPHPDRFNLGAYPLVTTLQARFSDVDANGHLNSLALESLHEDARANMNVQLVPGIFDPGQHTFRMVTSQNVVHFCAEAHWPTTITAGVGVGGIGRSSFVASGGLFISDQCISVCDMTLVLMDGHRPTAIPEDVRSVMRKLLLRTI